jgi:hypothetical protein
MSLAVVGFVLALGADYMHYARATKKLVAVINRNAGVAYDAPVVLKHSDITAGRWFTIKNWCLVVAYVVLTWAFVMRVYPEAGASVRWLAAVLTQ